MVVLMDIVIEKIYPLAYMSGEKGTKEAPWGEDEERVKQDVWRVSRCAFTAQG
jgi:breast cancer 2 susceptibility protein